MTTQRKEHILSLATERREAIYIYIYIYMHRAMCVHIYIYIYITKICMCICVCIYIHIYERSGSDLAASATRHRPQQRLGAELSLSCQSWSQYSCDRQTIATATAATIWRIGPNSANSTNSFIQSHQIHTQTYGYSCSVVAIVYWLHGLS